MSQTPILVVSCDRYADLWDPFFRLFRLRWPDCPFPVFLGANHLTYEDQGVSTLVIGDDESWASGVREMLQRVGTSHVILFLEDFFLTDRVDSALIEELVAVARREGVGCLRMVGQLPLAHPPDGVVAGYERLGEIERRAPYRVSAQVAIWRVDTLMKTLIPGANAWEFEEVGSRLSEGFEEPFWGVRKNAIHYEQVVEKGKWKPVGLRICEEAGVPVNPTERGVFSSIELDDHYARAGQGAEEALMRRAAAHSFILGRRLEGLRRILPAAARHPLSVRLWATALAGLAGPAAIRRLESIWLDRTIAKMARRVRKERRRG